MDLLDFTERELYDKFIKARDAGDEVAAKQLAALTKRRMQFSQRDYNTYQLEKGGMPQGLAEVYATDNDMSATRGHALFTGAVEGAGNLIRNVGSWITPDFIEEPFVENVYDPAMGAIAEFIPEPVADFFTPKEDGGFGYELARGLARESVGMIPANRIIAAGTGSLPMRALREAGRGALGTTLVAGEDTDLASNALVGAAGGAIGEVVGSGVSALSRRLHEASNKSNPELLRNYVRQYRELKKKVDDPLDPTTNTDVYKQALTDLDGVEQGITYQDMREVSEKANLIKRMNEAGGPGGISILQETAGNKVDLLKMGIAPNKTESAWSWMDKSFGRQFMEATGLADIALSAKRKDALTKVLDKKFDRVVDINKQIAELPTELSKFKGDKSQLTDEILALHKEKMDEFQAKVMKNADDLRLGIEIKDKKSIIKSQKATEDLERLMSEYQKTNKIPGSNEVELLFEINRDIKAARKLYETKGSALEGAPLAQLMPYLTIGSVSAMVSGLSPMAFAVGAGGVGARYLINKGVNRRIARGVSQVNDTFNAPIQGVANPWEEVVPPTVRPLGFADEDIKLGDLYKGSRGSEYLNDKFKTAVALGKDSVDINIGSGTIKIPLSPNGEPQITTGTLVAILAAIGAE